MWKRIIQFWQNSLKCSICASLISGSETYCHFLYFFFCPAVKEKKCLVPGLWLVKESKEDLKTWLTPQSHSAAVLQCFCADVLKQKKLFLQPHTQSVVRRRKSFFYKLDRSLAPCHTVTQWISADYPSSTSPRFSSHLAGRFPLSTLSRRCSNYQERGSWSP